jgi:hypothetical protein
VGSRREVDRKRTLEELEGVEWGPPTYPSQLTSTCHRLRKKPIGECGVEDLRMLIGQNVGLPFLVPLALELLERDALVAGDFYPGDLLGSLLRAERKYWERHASERGRLDVIVAGLGAVPEEIASELEKWREWRAR